VRVLKHYFLTRFLNIKTILFCFWRVNMLFSLFFWQFCCCYWWTHEIRRATCFRGGVVYVFCFAAASRFHNYTHYCSWWCDLLLLLYRYPKIPSSSCVSVCVISWCLEARKTTENEPLVTDIPILSVEEEGSEGGRNQPAWEKWSNDGTERQVAKLMEENVGAAMQFLQSKALCIMPISLASAIYHTQSPDSTTTLIKPETNSSSNIS